MDISKIAQILIYLHASFGGIALLAGAVALSAKKGRRVHKKAGKLFFVTMLISAAMALVIATMPGHHSPFLFSIGVFSSYFLVSGFRSLNFRKKEFSVQTDRWIAWLILITGISMMLYPIVFLGKVNIVLLVFGAFGVAFGARDLRLLRDLPKLRKSWLKLHLGKMTGGYIAAVTAFFVVNNVLPGIWNWFVPTIVGTVFISFWIRKVDTKKFTVPKTMKVPDGTLHGKK